MYSLAYDQVTKTNNLVSFCLLQYTKQKNIAKQYKNVACC